MRIGIGYDSHRFAEGRRLVLAGVEIPFDRGLAGHSDADAVALVFDENACVTWPTASPPRMPVRAIRITAVERRTVIVKGASLLS